MPHQVELFDLMRHTRSKFKLALRYCKLNEESLRCNSLARDFLSKPGDFWKKVKKQSNSKMTKFANSVNGATGDASIAGMWKKSFEALYNMDNTTDYHLLNDANVNKFVNDNVREICTRDLLTALQNLKLNKACGPDGIPAEAIKYGGQALMVHLSFLFSMFLTHSFLPTELIQTTLVPLLKNKTGNISDVNNYRVIALSNSISKLLKDVLLQSIKKV